jgi:transcriptional regulator with XRE-family HTH domain
VPLEELKLIGPRLRALRHSRGWTLEQLAERADMSPSTLSRLESGKRQAGLELLVPLARQLGIGLDDLVAPAVRDPRVRRPVIHRDGLEIPDRHLSDHLSADVREARTPGARWVRVAVRPLRSAPNAAG